MEEGQEKKLRGSTEKYLEGNIESMLIIGDWTR